MSASTYDAEIEVDAKSAEKLAHMLVDEVSKLRSLPVGNETYAFAFVIAAAEMMARAEAANPYDAVRECIDVLQRGSVVRRPGSDGIA